jgi:putative solute:sodium symporter small subunit
MSQNDSQSSREAYWKKNRQLIGILLAVWALVSYGFAILFPMKFSIGQLPAGFWWAQQGSMFVFVALIFIYAWRMDAIDREFDVHEEDK